MYLLREEEPRLTGMLAWKEALALIGPRRAGKTTLARQLLKNWSEEGNPGAYIDLEALDAPRTASALARQIQKIPQGGLAVLDEVQVLDGWIKVVREEIEKKQRHIVVTGSSASLLSKDIATSLAGRAIPEAVLPLSYRDAKSWGIRSLNQYLEVGGYPECVQRPHDAPRLHKLYLELTVLRDVAARQGLREIKPLSDLALLALSEAGKTLSAKKTSLALGISQPTLRAYMQALNDAFLILSVPPYLRSPREKIVADARHYAFDVGLQNSVRTSTEPDFGRRCENAVAVELFRRGYALSYLRASESECDFIAQKPGSPALAVQVWTGSEEVPEREWKGLAAGMKAARAQGLLLSLEPQEAKRKVPEIRALEAWLLEKPG